MIDSLDGNVLIIICSSFNFCERLVKTLVKFNISIAIGAILDERYYELCHNMGDNVVYFPINLTDSADIKYLYENVRRSFNKNVNFLINSVGFIGDDKQYNYKQLFSANCSSVINSCKVLKSFDSRCHILNFVLGDNHNYISSYSCYVGCKFFNLGYLTNFQKSYLGKITNIYVNEMESDKVIYEDYENKYSYLDIIDIVDIISYYIQNLKLYDRKINLEFRSERLIKN